MGNSSEFNKFRFHIVVTTTIVFVILKALEVDLLSAFSWEVIVLTPLLADLFASLFLPLDPSMGDPIVITILNRYSELLTILSKRVKSFFHD